LFWVIKGQKSIQEKLAIENEKVQKEILACNKLSSILWKNIKTMREGIKRGVKVKMICTFDKSKIPVYKEWLKTGAEIRVFNEKMFGPLLPRMSVFDGKIARVTIGKPEVKNEEEYITLWTESRAFSQMLKNHFMNMWKNSKSIKEHMK